VFQSPHNFIELLDIAIADPEHTAFAAVLDVNRKSQSICQSSLQGGHVGVFAPARTRLHVFLRSLALFLRQRLDLAHIQPLLDDVARHCFGIRLPEESARVASRELSRVDESFY